MREIVLDTETTGLDPQEGDRLVEIGCLELWDKIPTGNKYQCYINPLRPMSAGAREVTGYDDVFLAQYEPFEAQAQAFLDFIGDDSLVIHNAPFDMKFLNHELGLSGLPLLSWDRVVDTLNIARETYPGQRNSLDALCQRLGVDNSNRELHGALIDADLLAQVYLEMCGGRQKELSLTTNQNADSDISAQHDDIALQTDKTVKDARVFTVPDSERAAHLKHLKSIHRPIWKDYKDLSI